MALFANSIENSTKGKGRFRKVLKIAGVFLIVTALLAGAGGYFYWRHLRSTPQYSLALLIDAARRDDTAAIDELVDMNSVVDDFVPQITEKAAEYYGRGLPPETLVLAQAAAIPLLPAVKERARAELPRLIREKTEAFANVPFFAMAAGAERYLDITVIGDEATVRSILPRHSFEVTMRRQGTKWRITGVRDERLAANIARTIGEQIIGSISGDKNTVPNHGNLGELLKLAEEALKKDQ